MTGLRLGKSKKSIGKKACRPKPFPKLDLASSKRITYLDRVLIAIWVLIMAQGLHAYTHIFSLDDDLIATITDHAEQNGEVLAKRAREYIEVALDRLSRSRFIIFLLCVDSDDSDRLFKVHPDFQHILSLLNGQMEDLDLDPSSISNLPFNKYRAICNYFNQLITTSRKFSLVKRRTCLELIRENCDFRVMADARALSLGSTSTGTGQAYNGDCDDNMEVDDVPQASTGSTSLLTPLRNLLTVDAYPTPKSLPRPAANFSQSAFPFTPTRQGSASRASSHNWPDENQNTGSMDEDIDDARPSSPSTAPTVDAHWVKDLVASSALSAPEKKLVYAFIMQILAVRDEAEKYDNQNSKLMRLRWRLGIVYAQNQAKIQKASQREGLRVATLMEYGRSALQRIFGLRRAANARW